MNIFNLRVALNSFKKRRPFRNFTLELTSGNHVRISHPEAVLWKGEILLYFSSDGKYHVFDSESVCQLLEV